MTKFDDHNHQLDVLIKITNFNSQVFFYQDAQVKGIYSSTSAQERGNAK